MNVFDLLVVDENPTKSFFQKTETGLSDLVRVRSRLERSGKDVVDRIIETILWGLDEYEAGGKKYDLGRIYTTEAPAGSHWENQPNLWQLTGLDDSAKKTLVDSMSLLLRLGDESERDYQKRLRSEGVNLRMIQWLADVCADEPGRYVYFSHKRAEPVIFTSFVRRVPDFKYRVVMLDATGDVGEMSSLMHRQFVEVSGAVEYPHLSTALIRQASGKIKMSKMSEAALRSMLRAAASCLRDSDSKVLVATHKATEDACKRILAGILPDREIASCHFFGGSRGVNSFSSYDAVIAAGSPLPSPTGMYDYSMALVASEKDRVAWIQRQGTNELIQSIHRIRPVFGGKNIICVGAAFPISEFGTPQKIINRSRGSKAKTTGLTEVYDRVRPFAEATGFITKDILWVLQVVTFGDASRQRDVAAEAKKVLDAENEAWGKRKALHYFIKYLLSNVTLFGFTSYHLLTMTDFRAFPALVEKFNLPKIYLRVESGQQILFGCGRESDVRAFWSEGGFDLEEIYHNHLIFEGK